MDFQSPLPLRRADDILVTQLRHRRISIHAPRGGSDHDKDFVVDASTGISIHAPRGGSDERGIQIGGHAQHFNPRSPRGERLGVLSADRTAIAISIHAPRGGSDFFRVRSGYKYRLFQSTLPAGGATQESIRNPGRYRHFNPRSPRGERPCLFIHRRYQEMLFQSTLPAGGATRLKLCEEASDCISIHAPRGGSDLPFRAYCLIWNISIHAPRGGSD